MKPEDRLAAKELYQALRRLSWEQLWGEEVPRFDAAPPAERQKNVAVIRAVGVVFAESDRTEDKDKVQAWLTNLLQDPSEKIRRYAMAALPKIGAGANEERALLSVLRATTLEREKKFLAQTLGKIGGPAALEEPALGDAAQKIRAAIVRRESPSAIRLDATLANFSGVTINLRGRAGLEGIVRDEVEQFKPAKFRVAKVQPGVVAVVPVAAFSLRDIYAFRCFGAASFVLGQTAAGSLVDLATSPLARRLWQTFTEGSIRYRLNFADQGHQRAAVARLAAEIYARCPEILNDGRQVTWTIDIHPGARGQIMELRPNVTPEPRFSYRQRDVPAASHPPLAACLARLAGRVADEVVWDPFCGSGLELIESALLGGVRSIYGSDVSETAIAVARNNFAAADVKSTVAQFMCGDFRAVAAGKELKNARVTLIITNPPLGRRVPVANLRGMINDLFKIAAAMLKPGGRLVFVNPFPDLVPRQSLKLQFRQKVDLGGFECHLEKFLLSPEGSHGGAVC